MPNFTLYINGKERQINLDGSTPLLSELSSGEMKMVTVDEEDITTIEGLQQGDIFHPVQKAWIAEDVPQCGYCQSGQIMVATALLDRKPDPTDDDIDSAMKMNICRCGTYQRIRKAIHHAAGEIRRG